MVHQHNLAVFDLLHLSSVRFGGLEARWVGVICTGAEASGRPREPSGDIVGAKLDPERKEKRKGASGGECDKTERNLLQEGAIPERMHRSFLKKVNLTTLSRILHLRLHR